MDVIRCHKRLDSPEHQLIHKFIHIGRYHCGFMEKMLNKTGVYRSQHQILMYVAENPNVSQKELAGMYGVSGATIAVSLKKLEKGGYISRVADEKDSRLNHITVTEKGRQVVEDSLHLFRRMEQCMFSGFSENDMTILGQYFDRMYENLKQSQELLAGKEDH